MIASNSGPRWRTSTSTSPALRPRAIHSLTCAAIRRASTHARAVLALGVERRVPAFDLAPLGRRDQRPQLDQPGRGVGQRLCAAARRLVGGDAGKDFARANTRSTPPSTASPERNEWWKRK